MREPRLSAMTTDQMLSFVWQQAKDDPDWDSRRAERAGMAAQFLELYSDHRSRTANMNLPWEEKYLLPRERRSGHPLLGGWDQRTVKLPNCLTDAEAEELILRQLEEHACPR